MSLPAPRLAATLALTLAVAAPAAAQGKGNAYGRIKNARPPAASAGAPATAPAAGVGGSGEFTLPTGAARTFGSWLDDASMLPPGNGHLGVGVGLWSMPGYREFDAPIVDTAIGLRRRLQLAFSMPVYHAGEPDRPVLRGIGNMYLTTKVQLREPAEGRTGVSLAPTLELLSDAAGAAGRAGWILPVSLEHRRASWRTYGSAGFVSRGAVFASGAVEKAIAERLWATASLSHSYSTAGEAQEGPGVPRRWRSDATAGAAVSVSERASIFGSIGRTLAAPEGEGSSLVLAAGLSLGFSVR